MSLTIVVLYVASEDLMVMNAIALPSEITQQIFCGGILDIISCSKIIFLKTKLFQSMIVIYLYSSGTEDLVE